MIFQKVCTSDGIIVQVYYCDKFEHMSWVSLRNFGWCEGSAEYFRSFVCPNLSDFDIKLLIRNYKSSDKFHLFNGHFKRLSVR